MDNIARPSNNVKVLDPHYKIVAIKNAGADDVSNDKINTCYICKDNGWPHDSIARAKTAKTGAVTCYCPEGGGNRGVIVFDAKSHIIGCRFRKRIAHSGHEILSIVEVDPQVCGSIVNSSVSSLGSNDDDYSLGVSP